MMKKHVNVKNFMKSVRVQSRDFKSKIARTYDQIDILDDEYRKIRLKTVPILKKLDDPQFELAQKKKAKLRLARPPVDSFVQRPSPDNYYDCERDFHERQQRMFSSCLSSPISTVPFAAEKYTPFSTNAHKTQILRSYPSAFSPSKRKKKQEADIAKIPRVATIRKAPK